MMGNYLYKYFLPSLLLLFIIYLFIIYLTCCIFRFATKVNNCNIGTAAAKKSVK